MQRRRFISTLGQAGLAASGTFALASKVSAAAAKPRLRVGQIGTGHAHADGKLRALRSSSEYDVVGVVEPDERLRRLAMARKDYQGLTWLTEEQLFNTPNLKAVAVETEVKDLLGAGARCVAAGLHVHLDKPAGESLTEYRRLMDAATTRKLTVQMGYMFRYNPGFEFCFRAARDGWLGRISGIETVIGKASPAGERAKIRPYRGGTMFELGCHVIDAVITLLGKPDRVTAHGRHSGDFADDVLDNQVAILEYPHALVTVRSSLVEVAGNVRRQFVVIGNKGTVDLRPLEPPSLRLALEEPRGEFKKGYQDVKVPSLPRYAADFDDLARVIRGEKAFAWTPAHDLAVQETVLRASGLMV